MYNDIKGNWAPRSTIGFSISSDNGENWLNYEILDYAYPVQGNDERTSEFSYPAIIKGTDDRIYITYTWNRKTIAYWEIKLL